MAESIAIEAGEPSSVTTVEIRVRTLDSSNYTVRVNKDLPVPALKDQLAPVVGVPPQNQRLICRGRVLKDDQLLSSYNVEDGHTLHLVPRPAPSPNDDANQATQEPSAAHGHRHAQITHSLLLGTINIPEAAEGGPLPDLNRILSAVFNSVGSANAGDRGRGVAVMQVHSASGAPASSSGATPPAENNSSGRRQAAATSNTPDAFHFRNLEVAPDALTTIQHYITRMEQLLAENGYEMPGPLGAQLYSALANASGTSTTTPTRPLPTPASLGATISRVQELLQGQASAALTDLCALLAAEANVDDASRRAEFQSNAVWTGSMIQQLGALLLELGRTTMTLRLGPSPAQAVVNSGPAVFVSQTGPNPMMVQPLPFSFSSMHGEATPPTTAEASGQRNPGTGRRSFSSFFSSPLFQQHATSTDSAAPVPEANPTEATPPTQVPEARTGDQENDHQQSLGLLVQDNGSVRIVQMPVRGRQASGTTMTPIQSTIQTGLRGLRAVHDSAIAVPVLGIRAQVHTDGWTQAVLQASEGQRPVGIALTIPVDVAASQAGENAEQQAPATTSNHSVLATINESRTQREEATTVQNSGQADHEGVQSSRIEGSTQKMEVDQDERRERQRKRGGEEVSVNGGEESSMTSHNSKDSQTSETKRQKL